MAGRSGSEARRERVLTVPNVVSLLRLALIGVFVYLMLIARAEGAAVATLMISGASDWADGKLARILDQSSALGALLDPAIDRLYMVVVPVTLAVCGLVPWWIIAILMARDALLAAMVPALRSRGLTALPVTYIGKAGTFALMSAFPLILLGHYDALWSRVVAAVGWAFLIWGLGLYLWAFVLYVIQAAAVVRTIPKTAVSATAVPEDLAGRTPHG